MRRVGLRVAVFVLGAAGIASCLKDISGPGGMRRARVTLAPAFVSTGVPVVDFDRVRVTVERGLCGATDGGSTSTRNRAAVDTIVPFPASVDSIELALVIPLEAPQEEFLVFVRMITAQGDTVFRNTPYPQCVVAVAGGPSAAVATLLEYVGVGANAATVVITSLDSLVSFGATLDLVATALDATGKPIPGTPIVWSSLDPLRVGVPDAGVPQILGGSQRGPARIVAKLLTGQADTAIIKAQPLPDLLAIVSGNDQTGIPGLPLTEPLRVRVTGPDGLGVQVPVTFRPLIAGATVRDPVVLSDANGFAETVGILPLLTNLTAAFEASVPGVPTVVFSGLALTNVAQVVVTPATAGLDALGRTAQYSAEAKDASGQPLTRPFAWTTSDGGVATVDPGTGLVTALGNGTATITATAEGVSGSASFTVLQGVAQLVFTTLPSNAVAGVPITPAVQVAALDPGGSVATNFTGPVTLSRADIVACSGPLGTLTVPAVAGVATFSDVSFQQACPGLQLHATADTLTSPVSGPFTVAAGPAAALSMISGGGATDTVRATVPTLSVRVTDQFDNGVSGYPVSWLVTAGDGLLAVSVTDTGGNSSAAWTLGTTAGTNKVEARAGTLPGSPVLFTATAIPATATQLVFAVPPSDALVLQVISPPVEVVVRDQFGNTVTNWSTDVTMALGRNPLGTGLLLGTTSAPPAGGVAKFDNLLVDVVAAGYTLLATSSLIPTAESKPFNISLVAGGPVFGGDSAAGQSSGVFSVSADGANRSLLSDRGRVGDVYPRWSPDRALVAFSSDDQGGGTNALYVTSAAGTELATIVTDTSTRRPRWNPDGVHLAFECGPKAASLQDVCVVPDAAGPVSGLDRRGDGNGKIFVTDLTGDRLDGPGSFAWDPLDSKRLIVVRDSTTDQAQVASRLWYVNFDGAAAVELSPPVMNAGKGPLRIEGPLDITPDGVWIVFSAQDPEGTRSLFAIDREGKNLRPLTAGPNDRAPVISPDGREALFTRDAGCSLDYWRVTLADGLTDQVSAEAWCDISGREPGHDWSPDGKDIVLVGGNPPGGFGDFAIYTIPAGTNKDTYLSARRLIGRVGEFAGQVKDIQPSWRP